VLSLADGAQWIPDIVPVGETGGREDSRAAYISEITLNPGGIINMHGLNKHTNASETVNELTIYQLNTNAGVLRMDAEGDTVDSTYRNDSDFVTVQAGSGTLYVQPLDGNKLEGASYDNPVRIGDMATGISVYGLTSDASIVEGTLYDYTPIIARNVVSGRLGQYGNDWYIVGVEKEPNEVVDTVKGASGLIYGALASHRVIDSLQLRLGELRDYNSKDDGVWVRWKGGKMELRHDSWFDYQWDFYQLGYDTHRESDSGVWRYGGAIHTSEGDVDYRYGSGNLKSYGGAIYASWTGHHGHYVDYVAQYSHYRNKFTVGEGRESANGRYSNHVTGLSVEYGRKKEMGDNWFVEPQIQMAYSHADSVDYRLTNGVKARQDSIDSLIGRIGVRLGRRMETDNPETPAHIYGKLNLYHEFSGDHGIGLWGTDGAVFQETADGNDTWITAGIGGSFSLNDRAEVYFDAERSFGEDIRTAWQVNAGLRFSF
jgi:outer membrane autotransporter protein